MIYLARHGEAMSPQQNPDRPLSENGVDGVTRVATLLRDGAMRPNRIIHSGILRAQQTAGIFADIVAPSATLQSMDGLHPMDRVEDIALAIRTWGDSVFLVGHNPFMEALTARLLTGHENGALVAFEPGTVAALAPLTQDRSRFALMWHVNPRAISSASPE